MHRAQGGDAEAAVELLERTVGPLRRWARHRLPPYARADANTEDIVQDVVLRALGALKGFDHRTLGAWQAYLHEAVRNRIRDEIRRVQRRGVAEAVPDDLVDDQDSALERLIRRESTERYLVALRTLKPADRLAVIYRLEHRYRFDEIARRTARPSAAAARVAVARALKRLGAEMGLSREPSPRHPAEPGVTHTVKSPTPTATQSDEKTTTLPRATGPVKPPRTARPAPPR